MESFKDFWQYVRVKSLPEKKDMSSKTMYIMGSEDEWVSFLCPCGCGEEVPIPIAKGIEPHWDFKQHEDATVSLSPSILMTGGCKSHYFVKRGEIQRC